jgi:hypothetical protein
MILLDGYHDYMLLDSICKNLAKLLKAPEMVSADLLRFITSFRQISLSDQTKLKPSKPNHTTAPMSTSAKVNTSQA